jgi:hypothetical protein
MELMDQCVSSLESKFQTHNSKLIKIKDNRNFDAQTCDESLSNEHDLDKQIKQDLSPTIS